MRYQLDRQRYAVDTLDGETIIMDTVEGRLLLLSEGATIVWSALQAGPWSSELLERLEAQHGRALRDDAASLLEDLLQRAILQPGDEEDASASTFVWPERIGEIRMTAYDDMAEIITMDPIHDVDPNQGWPYGGS